MLIPIFSHDRYQLKTDTNIFINTDADTDMVLADTDIIKTDTDISVSANRYIGLSLMLRKEDKLRLSRAKVSTARVELHFSIGS